MRPDFFGGPEDVDRIKGTYGVISNFLMHGAFGVIESYIERNELTGALSVRPLPVLPMQGVDIFEVAANFTQRLITHLLPDETDSHQVEPGAT